MIKKLLKICLFLTPFGYFAQNMSILPETHLINISVKLNALGQNNPNGAINAIHALEYVKSVDLNSTTEINILMSLQNQTLPNSLSIPVFNAVNQFASNIIFSDNEQMLNVFKADQINFKNILISGLNSKSDATLLKNKLLTDKHVLFVNPNYETHELFIVYENRISDETFELIIKNTGNNIITSSEEISKYY